MSDTMKPKKIANKRDKDQMRVWSPDQHPPVIKDFTEDISDLNTEVTAISGEVERLGRGVLENSTHITMINNKLKQCDNDQRVIVYFEIDANLVYDGNLGTFAWNDSSWGDPNDDISRMFGRMMENDSNFDEILLYPSTIDDIPGLYIFESVVQDWYERVGCDVSIDPRMGDIGFTVERYDGAGWVEVVSENSIDFTELSGTFGIALQDITYFAKPRRSGTSPSYLYGMEVNVFFRPYFKTPFDPTQFQDGDRAKLKLRVNVSVNAPSYGMNAY